MGSNCAPLVADVFCYERDFMMSLSDDSQADIINDITKLIRFVRMSRHLTDLMLVTKLTANFSNNLLVS